MRHHGIMFTKNYWKPANILTKTMEMTEVEQVGLAERFSANIQKNSRVVRRIRPAPVA